MSQKPTVSSEEVSIRRAPKYLHFALTGFILGILIALLAGLSSPEVVGLLVVFGGIAGGGIGILLALLLDIVFRRSGKKLQATKIVE
ncbi:unannotated protein [freshwater metagenome]|uniref:Unannotated protein n=1 Tax=freshwater metagenome TaxID=449393 RepID=A0A6J6JJ76_9ZZZZ|nr:hypothetical protein [Actinomycetota bacterium]